MVFPWDRCRAHGPGRAGPGGCPAQLPTENGSQGAPAPRSVTLQEAGGSLTIL